MNHRQEPLYTFSSTFFRLHFNLIPFTPRIITTHRCNSLSPFNSHAIIYFLLIGHPFLHSFIFTLLSFLLVLLSSSFALVLSPPRYRLRYLFFSSSFSIITKREFAFISTHVSLVEYPRFVLSFEVSVDLVPPYRVCRLMPLILVSSSRSINPPHLPNLSFRSTQSHPPPFVLYAQTNSTTSQHPHGKHGSRECQGKLQDLRGSGSYGSRHRSRPPRG